MLPVVPELPEVPMEMPSEVSLETEPLSLEAVRRCGGEGEGWAAWVGV